MANNMLQNGKIKNKSMKKDIPFILSIVFSIHGTAAGKPVLYNAQASCYGHKNLLHHFLCLI
jgi:hypothetical protein